MRTRNADNPKSPTPAKRTPPARKSATKTPPPPPDVSLQSPSEATVTPKRASSTRGKAVVTNDTPTTTPETPVEAIKAQDGTVKVTPGTKSGTKKTVKRVVKRTIIRKKAKSGDGKTQSDSVAVEKDDIEVPADKESLEEVKDVGHAEQEELSPSDVKKSAEKEDHVDDVGMFLKGDKDVAEAEDTMKDVEESTDVQPSVEILGNSLRQGSSDVTDVGKSLEHQEPEVDVKEDMETEEKSLEVQEPSLEKEEVDEEENKETDDDKSLEIQEPSTEVGKEEEKETEEPDVEKHVKNQEIRMEKEKNVEMEQVPTEIDEDKVELENEPVEMEKDIDEEPKGEEDPQERVCLSDEEKDKDIGNDAHEEDDEDELADDKVAGHGEAGLEEEHAEFTAAAEERRRRKELEIFVGGLDRDATEEDVKKAFENVGEVVEVRMHKELPTNKNKGYAFVRFAQKEQADRALSEMKNPVIHGKRCGTAPSEDNDTLFLGNICNTWTKEAIRQKLKDYDIEGVERITLVADAQHEGLSRGFAFLEFSGHPDAMNAYKRLQKPDAIFGHPERTAKVAFAEPLREPNPEVLAQVKSVFVDGLPPHWDEDTVREHLKGYGNIDRIMLARNMSTAKRKDFGFIDFTTHEAAVACIDGINRRELGDEKMKVRARLSNPLPKTQAVKGGISGGFRIGHGSGATFPRPGRGFGRGAHPSNRMNFQRGRGFYQHGHGQTSRTGFAEDYPPAGPYPPFRGRQNFGRGGRWDNFSGPHQPSGQGTVPTRFDLDRPRHGPIMDRDHPTPMRGQPFLPEEEFSRPYGGRHYEDPYIYGEIARGVKRPYFADQDTDYVEPSRGRPRLDYSDPAISVPGTRFRGGGSGVHSRDYYNYDYDGSYSSYYGGDRPYGGGRPYGGRYYY